MWNWLAFGTNSPWEGENPDFFFFFPFFLCLQSSAKHCSGVHHIELDGLPGDTGWNSLTSVIDGVRLDELMILLALETHLQKSPAPREHSSACVWLITPVQQPSQLCLSWGWAWLLLLHRRQLWGKMSLLFVTMVDLQLKKQRCGREVKLKPWSWSMHPWSGNKSCSKGFLCQECSYWWSSSKSLSFFLCLLLVLHSVLWIFEDLLLLPNSNCCSSCDKSWWFKVIWWALCPPACLPCWCSLATSPFSTSERGGGISLFLSFFVHSVRSGSGVLSAWTLLLHAQLMLLGLFHCLDSLICLSLPATAAPPFGTLIWPRFTFLPSLLSSHSLQKLSRKSGDLLFLPSSCQWLDNVTLMWWTQATRKVLEDFGRPRPHYFGPHPAWTESRVYHKLSNGGITHLKNRTEV